MMTFILRNRLLVVIIVELLSIISYQLLTVQAFVGNNNNNIVKIISFKNHQIQQQIQQQKTIPSTITTTSLFVSTSAGSGSIQLNDDDDDDKNNNTDNNNIIQNLPKKLETALHRMRRRKSKILNKRKKIRTSYLFAAWYVLSVFYNIVSKKSLNIAPKLAWTSAWFQMSLGLSYIIPLWILKIRDIPSISKKDLTRLLPTAFLHSLVHIGGVVSMGAGAVSFTYIVKASEPAVSAVLLALTGVIYPISVYLTLFPVMGGVALASVSELSFTWKSFNYAMMSNIASSARGVYAKKSIKRRLGNHLSASNLYAIMTILSTCFIFPLALIMEGKHIIPAFKELSTNGTLLPYSIYTFLAALFYYTYNEVSFLCLKNVTPVSHAIGNTLKRVFIIISSLLVFGNPMTIRGIIGSTLAIGGVLIYSLEKQRCSEQIKATAKQKAITAASKKA